MRVVAWVECPGREGLQGIIPKGADSLAAVKGARVETLEVQLRILKNLVRLGPIAVRSLCMLSLHVPSKAFKRNAHLHTSKQQIRCASHNKRRK